MHDWFLQHEAAHRRAAATARASAHRQRVALGADTATRLLDAGLVLADRVRAWERDRRAQARSAVAVCECPVQVNPA